MWEVQIRCMTMKFDTTVPSITWNPPRRFGPQAEQSPYSTTLFFGAIIALLGKLVRLRSFRQIRSETYRADLSRIHEISQGPEYARDCLFMRGELLVMPRQLFGEPSLDFVQV